MIERQWVKRRWTEFKYGHSGYMAFVMGFVNFVVIMYTLAIERIPALNEIFPSMTYWLIFFSVIYVPAAVIIGRKVHLKNQLSTEAVQNAENNILSFVASPGKEQLFGLPAAIMMYEMQLRRMEVENQTADLLQEIHNRPFPRYSKEDFDAVRQFIEIAKRLMAGEKITDIVVSGK